MEYNSWLYVLLFLGCTVFLYYVFPLRMRWGVLLAASAAFYLFASRQLIVVMLLSTVIIYCAALELDRGEKRYQQQKAALPKEERRQVREKLALHNRHGKDQQKGDFALVIRLLHMLFLSLNQISP